MKSCKNRILCLLLCSMMLSTLMPISVLASELKLLDGMVASVIGEEEGVLPDEAGDGTAEDMPPLTESDKADSPGEAGDGTVEELPPSIEGDEAEPSDEIGGETVEDMTPLMEAAAPAVTGGGLLTDWRYTEEADRIILDQYIGTALDDIIIPGVFDGKSVVINASTRGFLPVDTETLKIGDADNTVTLTSNGFQWWPRNLVEADLSGLRHEFTQVTMFSGMTQLQRVDVTGWDVSKVELFSDTFKGCTSLQSVDLSSWDVTSASSFQSMFEGCTSLTSIDLSNWAGKTANVRFMIRMFSGCTSLEEANLTGWNLPVVTSIGNFFENCTSLSQLDLSTWRVGPMLNNAYRMFAGASSLEVLNLSGWDVSDLRTRAGMFRDCHNLKSLDLTDWKLNSRGSLSKMFEGCRSLTELDLSTWDISNVTILRDMFRGMSSLETLKIGNWKTSQVTDMSNMFNGTSKLRDFEVEKWDTSSVKNMSYMFYGQAADTKMDLSGWNTSNVTDMSHMFYGGNEDMGITSRLSSLNLSGWNTSNVTDMDSMFAHCNELQLFDLSSFSTAKAVTTSAIFTANHSVDVPTFIVTKDNRLMTEYGTSIPGRVYGGPSWDANGGDLSNGSSTATWGDKFVYPDKSGLTTTDVEVFNKYTATKVGDTFHGWFLDEEGMQEFKPDPAAPKTFDLMSDPKYVNMTLYASWKLPKSRITGFVETNGSRTITASLKRGDAVITTAAAIQGEFVMAAEAGVYTLELSAPAALTRRMEITVVAGINLEVATVDNPLTLIYGDANGDGIIDALDLGLIKTGFGKVKGDAGYTEYIDINLDGIVDALDLGHVKTWFGSTSGSYK